ncbi:MAG: TraR/DksA C4-type zinc finger protein [Patescibacteria group bacterium]
MTNKDLDLKFFKKKLEEEKATLISELKTVGEKNPDNPEDWVAKPTQMNATGADQNETADGYEAYGENAAILNELEIRLGEVNAAIKKITENKYGTCEICKQPIEVKRLKANPAAGTCIKHMK